MAGSPSGASARRMARVAGAFYLLTIVTGTLAFALPRWRTAADVAATGCYVAVTLLFYRLFAPVQPTVSLIAAAASMAGCGMSVLAAVQGRPAPVSPLAFFGVYCLLIGYLIVNSAFLPRSLGLLMAVGGLGWLTFALPRLGHALAPWNMLPGIVGEGALTIWLLLSGVNAARWQARAVHMGSSALGP